jgi:methylmalonyl-CoA mutase cobalamin-binding subunit
MSEARAALREKVLEVLYGDLIGPVQAADAAIDVVLEEAAKVAIASNYYGGHSIAAAIRAMKGKEV